MEIEVRVLNIDPNSMREKLLSLGGVLVKKENQVNKVFDFKDRSLLNKEGYARIRIIEDLILNERRVYMATKTRLTERKENFKVMDEHEILISDNVEGEEIFKTLGLIETSEIIKYRESYSLNNVLVEIDINDSSVYPIPYIEIEGNSRKEIGETLEKIGYKMEDTTTKTLFELIDEYNKNKN